jgi:hypothetical protein
MRVIVLSAAFLAVPVAAQNLQPLMRETPSTFFTTEDTKLFEATWNQVLEEAQDNQTRNWSNPKTGHGGDLTLQRTFAWRGNVCKEVRIRNQAQGRKGDSTLNSCKIDGKWRLVSAEQLQAK